MRFQKNLLLSVLVILVTLPSLNIKSANAAVMAAMSDDSDITGYSDNTDTSIVNLNQDIPTDINGDALEKAILSIDGQRENQAIQALIQGLGGTDSNDPVTQILTVAVMTGVVICLVVCDDNSSNAGNNLANIQASADPPSVSASTGNRSNQNISLTPDFADPSNNPANIQTSADPPTSVPEPSSILGSAIALGFIGAGLKLKFAQTKT